MLKTIIFAAALAGGIAFFTKPSEAEADDQLRIVLRDAIASGQLADNRDPAVTLLLAACRTDATACANLARTALRVDYHDHTLFARVDVRGFGQQTTCYALYTRLLCPGGFAE